MTTMLERPQTALLPDSVSLDATELARMNAYWRAANYLSVGQIYLLDNPLLHRAAQARTHQAPPARTLGNHARAEFHLCPHQPDHQEVRSERHLYRRAGTRRAGNGRQHLSGRNLQRSLSEYLAGREGMKRLFKQFSFPGGIPSHVAPETPGSIHEGGELGYALSHAYGAAFDNPDLLVCCVDRRRRSGNRAAGGQLALQQISQSGPRRRGSADPASQRLQNRQSRPSWRA